MKKPMVVLFCFALLAASCNSPGSKKDSSDTVSDKEEEEAGVWNDKGIEEREKENYVMAKYYNRKAISYENISEESKIIMMRNMVNNYKSLEEYDSAKMMLERILAFVPEGTYYYYIVKSDLYLLDNNARDALPLLKDALNIDPASLEVNNSLGLIYLGDYDEEYADYEYALYYNRKAYDIQVDQNTVETYIKSLYFLESYNRAESTFESGIKEYPNDADIMYWGSLIKRSLGKIDEAEKLKQQAIDINPANSEWFEDDEADAEEVSVEEEEEPVKEKNTLPRTK